MNDDARYVFARMDQKTLGLTFRLNYNVSPDLTIQYYGSPFTSAGTYDEFKIVNNSQADAYSDRFDKFSANQISYDADEELYSVDENGDGTTDYDFGQPNFNFAQFRSNLVVRWEYVPGSTLFLVWSQGRTMFNSTGEFDFGQSMGDLFDVKPHNIFLLKFSYRFSV